MLLHILAVSLLLLPLFVVAGLFALMVHITGSLASGALWMLVLAGVMALPLLERARRRWAKRRRARAHIPDLDARTARMRADLARVVRDALETHPQPGIRQDLREQWDGTLSLVVLAPTGADDIPPFSYTIPSVFVEITPTPALLARARPILEGSAHGLHPQARPLWWFWCAQMGPWTEHQPRYSAHGRLAARARAQIPSDTGPGALSR